MPLTGKPSTDIHELAHSGAGHRKRVRRFGKKKAHEVEVAIAMSARDRKRGGGKRKTKRATKRKTRRKSRRGSRR